jgi:hypothetical protein
MNDIRDTTQDRDTRIENFAAELTRAVYPLVLRRGLKDAWIKVELGLWRALAGTLQKRAPQQPADGSSAEFEAWREGLVVDLTESAFYIAVRHGTEGAFLELELGLYEAVRAALRGNRGWTPVCDATSSLGAGDGSSPR